MNTVSRFRNKTFWITLSSALILLAQQLRIATIPDNISDIINTILLIGTTIGVIVDPTTPGLYDSIQKKKD